jgi:hypothetical protein
VASGAMIQLRSFTRTLISETSVLFVFTIVLVMDGGRREIKIWRPVSASAVSD